MTDLERARARLTYGIIRDFGWDVLWRSANSIPDDAWPIDIIANALAAARREGAEEMRELAAHMARSILGSGSGTGEYIARAIEAALPLTPEER